MASSYVVLRCRAFFDPISVYLASHGPLQRFIAKNNWICEGDKDRPVPICTCQRVGVAKIITIHCPLSNCRFLMTPCPSPPSSTSFSYSDGLHGLHGILFYYIRFKISLAYSMNWRDLKNKSILQSQKNQIWSKSCPGMWWMRSFSNRQKGCLLAVLQQPVRHAIQVRGR